MLSTNPWQLGATDAPDLRLRLAHFWLSAPVDQLEMLWASQFGEISTRLIRQLTPSTVFSPDQIQLRDQLNNCLTNDLDGLVVVGLDSYFFCFLHPLFSSRP